MTIMKSMMAKIKANATKTTEAPTSVVRYANGTMSQILPNRYMSPGEAETAATGRFPIIYKIVDGVSSQMAPFDCTYDDLPEPTVDVEDEDSVLHNVIMRVQFGKDCISEDQARAEGLVI